MGNGIQKILLVLAVHNHKEVVVALDSVAEHATTASWCSGLLLLLMEGVGEMAHLVTSSPYAVLHVAIMVV